MTADSPSRRRSPTTPPVGKIIRVDTYNGTAQRSTFILGP